MQMMESLFLNLCLSLGKGPPILPTAWSQLVGRALPPGTTLLTDVLREKRAEKLKTTQTT